MAWVQCPERSCDGGTLYKQCDTCDGTGGKWKDFTCTREYTNPKDCPVCHGTGTYKDWSDCGTCDGKKFVSAGTCPTCGGRGEVFEPDPEPARDHADSDS